MPVNLLRILDFILVRESFVPHFLSVIVLVFLAANALRLINMNPKLVLRMNTESQNPTCQFLSLCGDVPISESPSSSNLQSQLFSRSPSSHASADQLLSLCNRRSGRC